MQIDKCTVYLRASTGPGMFSPGNRVDGYVPRVVGGWWVHGWAGTSYQGRVLGLTAALGCPLADPVAVPGYPWLTLTAPFQSQDPAIGFPSSQPTRVIKHERGGSA